MSLSYRAGNVLDCPERPVTFVHVVNDCGRFGAGFSGQLSARYPLAERNFREWAAPQYKGDPPYRLGSVQILSGVDGSAFNVHVANLCAQHGVGRGERRIDYAALRQCLAELAMIRAAAPTLGVLAMPRIGCGLGGGEWADVEPIVCASLADFHVLVYALEGTVLLSQKVEGSRAAGACALVLFCGRIGAHRSAPCKNPACSHSLPRWAGSWQLLLRSSRLRRQSA